MAAWRICDAKADGLGGTGHRGTLMKTAFCTSLGRNHLAHTFHPSVWLRQISRTCSSAVALCCSPVGALISACLCMLGPELSSLPTMKRPCGLPLILEMLVGCMSGLTLGLLSLDIVDLEVLKRSGSEQEQRCAKVRRRGRALHVRTHRTGHRGVGQGRSNFCIYLLSHPYRRKLFRS